MATFLGREGSMTFGGAAVANCRVIDYQTNRPKVITTVKGDRREKSVPGIPVSTIRFEGLLDSVTGQLDVINDFEAATPDETLKTLVFTVASGKSWTWTSGAYSLGYQITSPEGDAVVTIQIDFALTVEATLAWA
jgi:hypothetical protein